MGRKLATDIAQGVKRDGKIGYQSKVTVTFLTGDLNESGTVR